MPHRVSSRRRTMPLLLTALAILPISGLALALQPGVLEDRSREDRENRVFGAASLILERDVPEQNAETAQPTRTRSRSGAAPAAPEDAAQAPAPSPRTRRSAGNEVAPNIKEALELLGESPVAAVLSALPEEARRFNDHVITLANPFFEGRAPGTAGNRFAAEYIEFWFRKFDLDPVFPSTITAHDGSEVLDPRTSFRQPFSAGRQVRVVDRSAALRIPGVELPPLTHGRDFTVLGASGTGRASGPVVFGGYGIIDGPDGYTSFPPDADFTGKIVMIFRFEPMDVDGVSQWAERGWSPQAQLEPKIAAAIDRNAAGVVLVNPPGADDPRANSLIETSDVSGRASARSRPVPVVMISRSAAEDLFRGAFPDGDVTLSSARKQADMAGVPFELPNVTMEISARIAREEIMTDNVGAILPGRGELAREFIVIGAHYDHVGYGPAGVMNPANIGMLHPGADDNASGTAGMLILAEKLSKAYEELPPHEPARSVLFLAFSAEELGLIGSRYFVNNPPLGFDIDDIYMMLNLDMIGRLRETGPDGRGMLSQRGLTIQGVESAEGFLDWLQPHFDASDLRINHGGVVSGNSDHASFYRRQIPVLFFFTGLHDDYHRPSDVGALINQAGAARIIDLAYRVSLGLAQRQEPLEFVGRGGRPAARRSQEEPPRELDPAPAAETAGPRMSSGVRFGIAPGYTEDDNGVLVDDVPEDGSAYEAGIRPGDRIIRWNDTKVDNIRNWMGMLQQHKAGDVVKVTVVRDGQELTLTARLQGRQPN